MFELNKEISKAICGWICRADKLRRVIIRQMRITNSHMKGIQKALTAKLGQLEHVEVCSLNEFTNEEKQ